ncbi:hypothetical protein N7495_001730 [Penicillium taxi]|uniref:uncharacterized protein n=1 Tax=Penicillium taxi TaxID=168475 RepID=UPI0025456EB6|nr:uncharacterized protein N7495_001730 [Penicillium taxi]KAJ5909048.1 hypothetical protein N7495_001730 [Penicillium taxi]
MAALPDEILFLILDQIGDNKLRLELLLVCRRWYNLLFSKVYERIDVKCQQIRDLLCSVQNNSKIGTAFRELSFDESFTEGFDPNDIMPIEIMKQVSPSSEFYKDWERDLFHDHDYGAHLALLVPSLQSVKALRLTGYLCYSEPFFGLLARAAAREKPFDSKSVLQSLEKVELRPLHLKAHYGRNISLFFSFPAMRVLSVSQLAEEDIEWTKLNYPKLVPGFSSITELHFEYCTGSKGMAEYIEACANLEVFNYQHQVQAIWGEAYHRFRPLAFYKPLLNQKNSLRVLRLDNIGESDPDFEVEYDIDLDYVSFGSLTEFRVLRELRIPLRTLLQYDSNNRPAVSLLKVLPSSIQILQLAKVCEEDLKVLVENLREVLARREDRFPNLNRLEIQPRLLEKDPSRVVYNPHWECSWHVLKIPISFKEAFAPIQLLCDSIGIEFEFNEQGPRQ